MISSHTWNGIEKGTQNNLQRMLFNSRSRLRIRYDEIPEEWPSRSLETDLFWGGRVTVVTLHLPRV